MPTYSYICDACGKSFEKEQRIIEDAIKDCELCGKPKARRQYVSGNFIFEGRRLVFRRLREREELHVERLRQQQEHQQLHVERLRQQQELRQRDQD